MARAGGPIRIPKIYDGRNKTFFYVSTEGYRQFDAVTSSSSVPTPLERIGDFSQSVNRAGQPVQQIIDPLTGRPFAGNVIPANRISPQAAALLGYYPQPNFTGTGYNYEASLTNFTLTPA